MGRTGTYEMQPAGYRAFVPVPMPPADLRVDARLQGLTSAADIALGRLDGSMIAVPDPDMFVFQYVRREAVLSSQIEGTQASLMEVLEYEASMAKAEARIDVREIVNHIAAMEYGLRRLPELPLSRRLLCEVHEVLMRGVRGGEPAKTPGEFRRSQNWIGGGSPATARFVPPPAETVGDLFANLEAFLHDVEPMPPLIKIGLAHAQFETIHPFLDGNGRMGRLLITFWLAERGLLRRPLLYPSLYFKEHRDEYIGRLQAIRDEGAWEEWLAFFLDGIAQVAKEAAETAGLLTQLRERDRTRIGEVLGRRAGSALALHDALFQRPLITLRGVREVLKVSAPTASSLLTAMAAAGILRETTGKQRNRIFAYAEYLDLIPGSSSRG